MAIMTTTTTGVDGAVLRDGTPVTVRPMRPDDEERLVAFHARLSPDSQRLRFFAPHPRLSDREVERFTHVDGHWRVALVADRGGEIVAVARFDRLPNGTVAEAAFVVRDDLQGRGLGTLLMDRLAARARHEGITHLVADTLPENARMLRVLRAFSPAATSRMSDGVVHVTIPLETARSGTFAPIPGRDESGDWHQGEREEAVMSITSGTGSDPTAPHAAGDSLSIRAVDPSDVDDLVALHGRLSPTTLRCRFLTTHPDLSAGRIRELTEVDGHDRVTLVATLDMGDELGHGGGPVVGVARYERRGDTDDVLVRLIVDDSVRDSDEGRDLEVLLLERLAAAARGRGIRRLLVGVSPIDRRLIERLDDSPFDVGRSPHGGIATRALRLPPYA